MRDNKLIPAIVLFLLFFALPNLTAAFGQSRPTDKRIEVFEVAQNRVYCEQIVPKKCLQIRREGQEKFEPLWDEIENFAYLPGYRYQLRVEIEKIQYPPKDTSGWKYYLKEIISRRKTDKRAEFADLYLSKWFLTAISGKKISGGKPSILFNQNARVFGNAGCNSFSGQYTFGNNSIKFQEFAVTKRACPILTAVETPFLTNLREADKFEVESDRLYFYRKGVVILEFRSNWQE